MREIGSRRASQSSPPSKEHQIVSKPDLCASTCDRDAARARGRARVFQTQTETETETETEIETKTETETETETETQTDRERACTGRGGRERLHVYRCDYLSISCSLHHRCLARASSTARPTAVPALVVVARPVDRVAASRSPATFCEARSQASLPCQRTYVASL